MSIVWIILLILAILTSWVLGLLGMGGTWIMVGCAALYAALIPPGREDIGWQTIVVLIIIAAIGELLEFLAGALGARKAGGSRRSVVLSVMGSIFGGFLGLMLGSAVVPVIGSVIGAILIAGLGAMFGAMLGERWKGKGSMDSLKVGKAAFFGRVLGTLAKTFCGTLMAMAVIVALVW